MEYGPVDVIVLATGEPKFDGSIMKEIKSAVDAGSIRVLDAMVIVADESGEMSALDIEDMPEEDKAALGLIETGTRGLFDAEDSAVFMEGMVPGSAIVALAIENAWAVPLMNAFAEAGTEMAMHTRIPGPVVDDALNAVGAGE